MKVATVRKKKRIEVRLGDVIIDPAYQIRMKVNNQRIRDYVTCMEYGDVFPPIVIERKSNKLVCGFTRMEAYQRVCSPDDKVPAVFMGFKTEKERVLFGVNDNRNHGEPLQSWDKKNLICRLTDLKVSSERISALLGWDQVRVDNIAGLDVIVVGGEEEKANESDTIISRKKDKFVLVDGKKKVTKRGFPPHLNGTKVTKKTYKDIVEKDVGWSTKFLADILIMRIRNGTIDLVSKGDVESLKSLYSLLKDIYGEDD